MYQDNGQRSRSLTADFTATRRRNWPAAMCGRRRQTKQRIRDLTLYLLMATMDSMSKVGSDLRRAIACSGLNRVQLAKRSGVAYGLVHRFCGNPDIELTVANLERLAATLDLDVRLVSKSGEVVRLSPDVPAIPFARAFIARDLIRQRQELGITQAELARRAGIRTETLCRLEAGKRKPTVATIDRLHKALKEAAADKPSSTPAPRKRRPGKRSAKT